MHLHDHNHSTKELSKEEVIALLKYMADHNKHHSEELHNLSDNLSALGKEQSAEKIHQASHLLHEAGEIIESTLKDID